MCQDPSRKEQGPDHIPSYDALHISRHCHWPANETQGPMDFAFLHTAASLGSPGPLINPAAKPPNMCCIPNLEHKLTKNKSCLKYLARIKLFHSFIHQYGHLEQATQRDNQLGLEMDIRRTGLTAFRK